MLRTSNDILGTPIQSYLPTHHTSVKRIHFIKITITISIFQLMTKLYMNGEAQKAAPHPYLYSLIRYFSYRKS